MTPHSLKKSCVWMALLVASMMLGSASSTSAQENTRCDKAVQVGINPDNDDTGTRLSAPNEERWYVMVAVGGRSYNVRTTIPFDDFDDALSTSNNPTSPNTKIYLYTGCFGTTPGRLFANNDDNIDEPSHPLGSSVGFQVTKTTGCGFLDLCRLYIKVQGLDGSYAFSFRIRVYETTVFGPQWFTVGSFDSYLVLQNTNRRGFEFTVNYFEKGVVYPLVSYDGVIVGNNSTVISTRALGLTSRQGSLVSTHDGPIGAIKGVIDILTMSGGVIIWSVPLETRWP